MKCFMFFLYAMLLILSNPSSAQINHKEDSIATNERSFTIKIDSLPCNLSWYRCDVGFLNNFPLKPKDVLSDDGFIWGYTIRRIKKCND